MRSHTRVGTRARADLQHHLLLSQRLQYYSSTMVHVYVIEYSSIGTLVHTYPGTNKRQVEKHKLCTINVPALHQKDGAHLRTYVRSRGYVLLPGSVLLCALHLPIAGPTHTELPLSRHFHLACD